MAGVDPPQFSMAGVDPPQFFTRAEGVVKPLHFIIGQNWLLSYGTLVVNAFDLKPQGRGGIKTSPLIMDQFDYYGSWYFSFWSFGNFSDTNRFVWLVDCLILSYYIHHQSLQRSLQQPQPQSTLTTITINTTWHNHNHNNTITTTTTITITITIIVLQL